MRIVLIGSEAPGLGAALAAHLRLDHIHRLDAASAAGFVLEGAPRDIEQARALDDRLRTRGAEVDAVLWVSGWILSPQLEAVLDHYRSRVVQLDAGAEPLEAALDGLREALLTA